MRLILDIGNTSVKIGIVSNGHLRKDTINVDHKDLETTLRSLIDADNTVSTAVVSNVAQTALPGLQFLHEIVEVFTIDSGIRLPFRNLYTSSTLGSDRIALGAAAVLQFQNTDRLVIDAGTCITYDFIDRKNQYYGGAISPGLSLRYKALHQHTARLPLLQQVDSAALTGDSTVNSIHSGVINGAQTEIEGMIKRYKRQYPDLVTLITGGSAALLTKQLKNRFFAQPNLMLQGINFLYEFNL